MVKQWSGISIPGTYRIYNNSREYRARHFGGVVGVIHATYELVMLGAIQTADDGENDDGKEGDDDAGRRALELAHNSIDVRLRSWLDGDGGQQGETGSQDSPRPSLHRSNDRLHFGGDVLVASIC